LGGGNKSYPPFLLTLKRINMLDYQTIDETIKATLLDKKGSGATPKVKTGGYDVSSGFLAMLQKTLESQVKKTSKKASEALQESSSDSLTSKTNPKELEVGDQFFGSITTTKKNEAGKKSRYKPIDYWKVIKKEKNEATGNTSFTVENPQGEKYKTSPGGINMQNPSEHQEKLRKLAEKLKAEEEEKKRKAEEEAKMIDMSKLQPHEQLKKLIEAGMRNIWMVGPAGCGKSTMARMTAKELNLPYLCISCGIGTSATEFLGYKYPTRESTKFAEYYAKPSIILIDEMTALDPAVGQVLNAALANDEIETTTGLVSRNPECIIIATSNTFGSGASRQYVANNQLDASTIDRFIGGIIEVDYSVDYESQYDVDVVNYVWKLRECIKACNIRRIASTRMIQSGTRMKKAYFKNWKDMLICNWTDTEREMVKKFFTPENKERITESKELDSSGRTKVFFG
jgi:DNA replication protein DnaC